MSTAPFASEIWQRRYRRGRQMWETAEAIAEHDIQALFEQQRQLRSRGALAALPARIPVAAQYPDLCGQPAGFSNTGRTRVLPGELAMPEWLRRIQPRSEIDQSSAARVIPVVAPSNRGALIMPGFLDAETARLSPGFRQLLARVDEQLNWAGEQQLARQQLNQEAGHDELTGLPNRISFLNRLHEAIKRRRRQPQYHVAVLCLDLDGFKDVNDSLGYATGDALLARVAGRLSSALDNGAPPAARHALARLRGDEFVILAEDLRRMQEAARLAVRLQQCLERPFSVAGQEVYLTASIGITGCDGSEPVEQVLDKANVAMHRAKRESRTAFTVYEDRMHAEAMRRLKLEADLRHALQRGEFVLHFQPIVSGAGSAADPASWLGMEALVRWQRPDGMLVYPDDFLAVAEETGLDTELGHWVLRQACATLSRWHTRYPHLRVGVNLTPHQLVEPGLVRKVRDILEETALPTAALCLEVTESVMISNPGKVLEVFRKLKALGVRLSLDDFGTGYSSLSYLHQFSFDSLKIDRSFVAALGTAAKHSEQETIIQSILGMARGLGLLVIAEGAETSEHVACLRQMGCGHIQGNYFVRPRPASELEVLLTAPPTAGAA